MSEGDSREALLAHVVDSFRTLDRAQGAARRQLLEAGFWFQMDRGVELYRPSFAREARWRFKQWNLHRRTLRWD